MRLTILLAAALLFACICITAVQAISPQDKQLILDQHNAARRRMPAETMPDLVWDADLEYVATTYASKCAWGHNPNRRAEYAARSGKTDSVGENIAAAWSSGGSPTVNHTGRGWYTEEQWYSYGAYPDICTAPADKSCGHWTQIIWATSLRIGCGAVTTCQNFNGVNMPSTYLVCNFAPAGNMQGSTPYVKGTPAPTTPVTPTPAPKAPVTPTPAPKAPVSPPSGSPLAPQPGAPTDNTTSPSTGASASTTASFALIAATICVSFLF